MFYGVWVGHGGRERGLRVRLSKNVGQHSWPTAKKKKKITLAKMFKTVPINNKTKFGPENKSFKTPYLELRF